MLTELEKTEPLLFDETYHVYNRTVGNERLFMNDKDYFFFLHRVERYLLPVSRIYVYCLLPNHFHFLLKIKNAEEIEALKLSPKETVVSRAFSNFFISYSKSFNHAHHRMGRLFLQCFKRILVEDDDYFLTLINYIHRNPIHHGLNPNYSNWKYSSYNTYLSDNPTKLAKQEVLSHFSSLDEFVLFHEENKEVSDGEGYFFE